MAARNGIPSDMPDSVRRQIADFKQGQMDKRKRDRDERLGLLQLGEDEEEEKPDVKKRKRNGVAGKGKDREMDSAERKREEEEEEERKRVEDEKRRKRFHKYCLDGEFPTSVVLWAGIHSGVQQDGTPWRPRARWSGGERSD